MPANPRISESRVRRPPPPLPPHTEMRGRHIALVPLADEHFGELYGHSHGSRARAAVWRYLPYGPFADAAAMRACYGDMAAGGDARFYAVRHRADNALAGIVSYLRLQPAAYSIEIGHIWHAAARQRGRANSEAAYLLLRRAFAAGYRRVEWKCNAANMRSRAAALRLGFAFEGVFRRHVVFKGRNRDTAWFALLDADWPPVRRNFEKWLKGGGASLAAMNRPHVAWSLPAHAAWPAV